MSTIDITRETFNTKRVCEILNVTSRKIRYWDKQGVVRPSANPANGRGSRRLYRYVDLLAIKTVQGLREEDVSLQKIRKCIDYLRKNLPNISHPLSYCTLLTYGNTVLLVKDEKTLVDTVCRQGQQVFRNIIMIDIATEDRELRNRVYQLNTRRMEEIEIGDYCYQVQIEPDSEDGGYVAEVAGLPGCITQGDTIEETLEMARDAISCYLEASEDLKNRGIKLALDRKPQKKIRLA